MIIGPSFNFIVYYLDVKIGPFLLDKLSAPGVKTLFSIFILFSKFLVLEIISIFHVQLLMAASWIILEILTVFFYTNLHEFSEVRPRNGLLSDEQPDETSPIRVNESSNINTTYNSISPLPINRTNQKGDDDNESLSMRDEENDDELNNNNNQSSSVNSSNGYDRIHVIDNAESGPFIVRFYNEYIRDEMVAVLATTFTVFFMQTCLEVPSRLKTHLTIKFFILSLCTF